MQTLALFVDTDRAPSEVAKLVGPSTAWQPTGTGGVEGAVGDMWVFVYPNPYVDDLDIPFEAYALVIDTSSRDLDACRVQIDAARAALRGLSAKMMIVRDVDELIERFDAPTAS